MHSNPALTTVSMTRNKTSRNPGSDGTMEKGIFEGLKVLDCASFIAAPAAATVLSDFGADVIKIEPPGLGDPYRNLPNLPGYPASPHNFAWMLESRNKKSLALDLSKAEGRRVLYRLVGETDVFITNFPPAVRKRLGITYEELMPLNERLIYGSFTGYGEKGAEADKPGFDSNAYWARPRERALNAVTNHYQCKDERWLILSLLNEERQWPTLATCLGREDLITDPRFATRPDRHARSVELIKIFDDIFATRDLAEWRRILDGNGLVFGVVGILDDIPDDKQMIENEVLVPFEDDTMLTISSPIWVDGSKKVRPRRPPGIGEHSDEILRGAGYD